MLGRLAAPIFALAFGALVGYLLGERQGLTRGLHYLEGEVVDRLRFDVETASCVRTGDNKRALELLDLRVDGAVLALTAARRNVGVLASEAYGAQPEQAMALAKSYRSVVPPVGRNATAVSAALEGVPAATSPPPALAALTKRVGG